jgi:hypothetical protein
MKPALKDHSCTTEEEKEGIFQKMFHKVVLYYIKYEEL